MKILFVLDSLRIGGAEKGLLTLLSMLDRSHDEIDLLLFQRGGMFEKIVPSEVNILDGLDYVRYTIIPFGLLLRESFQKGDIKKIIARLRNTIRQRLLSGKIHGAQIFWESFGHHIDTNPVQYDTAIAFSQGLPTYFVAAKVHAKRKIAVVNTDYIAAGYDKVHDRPFYNIYDTIVVDGEHGRKIMEQTFPEFSTKIEVIYDIVSSDVIRQMADNGKSFDDGYEGIRILTIGRLSEAKGYDIALDACRKLKEKGLAFRWYVLGDGLLFTQIEEYINKYSLQNDFILLGSTLNPYPYLNDCNIYVQTSKFEGYGTTVVEARLLNKPIVTTNFTVVYEQITDGKNGIIVEMKADAVCEGILRLIKNMELVNSMVECLKKEKKGNVEEVEKWQNLIVSDV